MHYDGKHVLVLGLGESGLAMALWLQRCGARVRVADTRAAPERLAQWQAAGADGGENDNAFIAGPFDAALLEGIDLIAVSPGLSPLRELAAIGAAAEASGIPVVGEIELFAQALAGLRTSSAYAPKVIAITGTNGKTTVTRLTGLLCERSGLRVAVAGNISPSALDVLRMALAACAANASMDAEVGDGADGADGAGTSNASNAANGTLPQVWVLELSSFQLHHTYTLAADAATVLNISQDHLDWHGDLAAYVEAKAQVFGAQTVRVLNRDDAAVMQLASPMAKVITFGADEAECVDCFGLVEEHGMQWLSLAVPAEQESPKRKKKGDKTLAPVMTSRLMPADALKIRGRHNAVNALAALALCRTIGLPLAPLLHGLRDYQGEPHRVELVTTIGEVAYYDDSKGTNVGATVAALVGLGVQPGSPDGTSKRLWLIAGGEGKGQDFAPLAAPVQHYARAVLLIGRDAPQIRAALAGAQTELTDCATLEAAVGYAAAHAQAGDIVLLSPACASFDMFTGYGHRAQVFIDAVREVALSRGEVVA
ncbi:MAG: UDP-N-acetylmuramoyl-L-alanine--D-glutamate ligase [Herminiimonas sp.]|nr:UDP-N-acetylmuramoyl-L-alanine--D-glutamate ligase [Herminiimonas sp.]